MSKHVPRKARWTQINSKEYRSTFGVVRYQAGAWQGTVNYELAEIDLDNHVLLSWRNESESTGRYKRPRNAMMAVEDKAREIRRRHKDLVKIAFEG